MQLGKHDDLRWYGYILRASNLAILKTILKGDSKMSKERKTGEDVEILYSYQAITDD